MEENEQAVVEQPDEQVPPVSEENDAQDIDLDSLLADYQESGEPDEQPSGDSDKSLTKDELSEKLSRIENIERLLTQEQKTKAEQAAAKAFDETVTAIKGDLDIPDVLVKGFLQQKALDNPKLQHAYADKEVNTSQWAKVEASLQKELHSLLDSLPNKEVTETRNQVASAVRNAKSTTPNSNPENFKTIGQKSDTDFETYKRELFKGAMKGS